MENLLKDKPETVGQVLENIGYSKGVSETPAMVVETPGFKQAIRELGLTEQLITNSLVDDIKEKPKNRIQELKLGAEILGMVKRETEPEKPKDTNVYNFFFEPTFQQNIKNYDENFKNQILKAQHVEETETN